MGLPRMSVTKASFPITFVLLLRTRSDFLDSSTVFYRQTSVLRNILSLITLMLCLFTVLLSSKRTIGL